MEWVETTGRTVAEAVDTALDELGVDEEEADVQVLDQPQTGLFGRLRVEARIRARVRPKRPPAKIDRRDRRRRNGRQRGESTTDQPEQGPSRGPDTDHKRRQRRRRSRPKGTGVPQDGDSQPMSSEINNSPGAAPNQDVESSGVATAAIDLQGQRDTVEEFLGGLTTAFGRPEAVVSAEISDDSMITADVQGDGLGLLVGPKGQTLQAIHELVRSVVQRQFAGQSHARLQLDVGGYRQRRREALERFTRSLADEVLSSGRAKILDPMSAADRKVVHDVANSIDGVQTLSKGDEPQRRVIIEVADAREGP